MSFFNFGKKQTESVPSIEPVPSEKYRCGCGKTEYYLENNALKECLMCMDCGLELHDTYNRLIHRYCKVVKL